MQREIKILTYGGRMVIDLDEFLPTSKKYLRKLFRTINGDVDHREELMETMEVYCKEKREELLEMLNGYATSASNFKREAEDLDQVIDEQEKRIRTMQVEAQNKDLIKEEKDRLRKLKALRKTRMERSKDRKELYKHTRIRADRLKECEGVIREERSGKCKT